MAGRPSKLDEPGMIELIAAAFNEGFTRERMMQEFGIKQKYTITRWRRDPRVRAKATELAQDRILSVVRHTDSVIERRLRDASEMSTRDLLDIRKTFTAGPGFRNEEELVTPKTITEATEAMEKDPTLAESLRQLLEGATSDPSEADRAKGSADARAASALRGKGALADSSAE